MKIKNDVNWEHFASTNDSSEREALSNELFTDAAEQFVQKTLALIDQEFNVLTTQARRLADGYRRFNKMLREGGGKENQGYYGTRVRSIGSNGAYGSRKPVESPQARLRGEFEYFP